MMARSTRRGWLIGAVGAALGLLGRGSSAAEEVPGPQTEYGGFPLGLQSYSLRHLDVDAMLAVVRDLGLHHVELYGAHYPVASTDRDIPEMSKKVRRLEISIAGHGVNRFTSDHDANRRIFEFANKAGIRNLSADPDPTPAVFDSLERLVEEFGIRIAIHNHGPGHHYSTIEDLEGALRGRHPWIGACADLGHFIRSQVDPVEAIQALAGRLYGVHLKDFDAPAAAARGVILGRGLLDLKGVFRALRKVEFPADGALSLEYEEPESPEADIAACLRAIAVTVTETIDDSAAA